MKNGEFFVFTAWIVIVAEIVVFEIGDFWNFVYYNENMNFVPELIKVVYWSKIQNFLAVFVNR
jgi:hypothetical protein